MFGKEISDWLKNKGPEILEKLNEFHEDLKKVGELKETLAGVEKELAQINKTVDLVGGYLKKVVMEKPELASRILGFLLDMGKDDGKKEEK